MKTRSQTIRSIIETEIDFDAASLAWNENKNKLGNGCYEYKKTAVYSKRRTVFINIHCYKCLNEGKKCNK